MNTTDMIKNGVKLTVLYGVGSIIKSCTKPYIFGRGKLEALAVTATSMIATVFVTEKVGEWTDLKVDQILDKINEVKENGDGLAYSA